MKIGKLILISINILTVYQVISFTQSTSSATLKTWYYLGMTGNYYEYPNLGPQDKICQGFKPPKSWTISTISIYAEYSEEVDGVERKENLL